MGTYFKAISSIFLSVGAAHQRMQTVPWTLVCSNGSIHSFVWWSNANLQMPWKALNGNSAILAIFWTFSPIFPSVRAPRDSQPPIREHRLFRPLFPVQRAVFSLSFDDLMWICKYLTKLSMANLPFWQFLGHFHQFLLQSGTYERVVCATFTLHQYF